MKFSNVMMLVVAFSTAIFAQAQNKPQVMSVASQLQQRPANLYYAGMKTWSVAGEFQPQPADLYYAGATAERPSNHVTDPVDGTTRTAPVKASFIPALVAPKK
jgi:hypothetical protein